MSTAHATPDIQEALHALSRAIACAKAEGRNPSELIAQHKALRQQALPEGSAAPRPPGAAAPQLHVLTDLAAVPAGPYDELMQASGTASPFLALDWLQPWYQSFGAGYEAHVLIVEKSGQWLAALPLMIGCEKRHGLSRRTARFIGTGPGLRGNYFALVQREPGSAAVRTLLGAHLQALLDDTTLLLENLSPYQDGLETLALVCGDPGLEASLATQRPCLHGALPSSFEEFIASVPTATRRNCLRRGDEALRQQGEVEYRLCERPGQVGGFLEWLARFNISRREREGTSSTWADPRNMACRQQVCERALAHETLRLETLCLDGAPVAALMGFTCKGKYFCYNMGFEQSLARFQPGHLLLAHRIRECIEEGLTGFDFLVGEAPYKRQYFSHALPELAVTVLPSRGAQHCMHGAVQILRGLRKLKRL